MMGKLRAIKPLAALLLVAAAVTPAYRAQAGMPAVRISFSTWTGYGPLVVGVQKGIFAKHGLNVTYSLIEDPNERRAAVQAGQLDGVASTVDTFTHWAAIGVPVVQVLGIDKSEGGDGIVAKKSITSVKQLKGKTVAVNIGSTSEWFLDYVLKQNGMTFSDIKIQDMPDSGVAGSTFVAGKVDAAVTWQPWLGRADSVPFGHILVSSAKYPNIIVDDLAFSAGYARAHPDVVATFVKAYYDAVSYVKTDPKDALPVIGKFTHETNSGVQSDLATVPLMDLPTARKYFGTSAKPGPIYDVSRLAANFWISIKQISKAPNFSQIIDSSYLQKM
jgi:NitT/TauT family transport system substrate-binding protein